MGRAAGAGGIEPGVQQVHCQCFPKGKLSRRVSHGVRPYSQGTVDCWAQECIFTEGLQFSLSGGKSSKAGNKSVKRSREIKVFPRGSSMTQGGESLALSFGSPRGPFRMSGWQSVVTRWSSCDSDSRPLRGSLCQHLPPCSAGTLVPPPLSRRFSTRGLCLPWSTPHTVMVTSTHSVSFSLSPPDLNI